VQPAYPVQQSVPPFAPYQPPPPPPPRGRSPYLLPLVALSAAVVVVVVAIVVVVAVKSNSNTNLQGGQTGGPSASPAASALIDSCLVGTWTITKATQQFPVTGVGNVPLSLKSGAPTLTIGPDGKVQENYHGQSKYEGSAGGHTYTLDVSGTATYTIRTANGTVTFSATSADGTIAGSLDGISVTSVPLSINTDPVKYTCSGSTATEHTDNFDATLTKQG
jgi:hypothetical protein